MEEVRYSSEDLVPRLISEFRYSPELAEAAAQDLSSADPRVMRAFWRWWNTGELDNSLVIEGYTVRRLMEERQQQPVAAFRLLAWLAADPATALRRLQRRRERPPVFASASATTGGEATAKNGTSRPEEVPGVAEGGVPPMTSGSNHPTVTPGEGSPESRVTSPRSFPKRRVPAEIPGLGHVILTPFTMGTVSDALERSLEADAGAEAIAFSNTLLAGIFMEPQMRMADVAGFSDETVAALVEVTIRELSDVSRYDAGSENIEPRERLYRAFLERERVRSVQWRSATAAITSPTAILNRSLSIPATYDWTGGIKNTLSGFNTASSIFQSYGLAKPLGWDTSALAASAERFPELVDKQLQLVSAFRTSVQGLIPDISRNLDRYTWLTGRDPWRSDDNLFRRMLDDHNRFSARLLNDLSAFRLVDVARLTSTSLNVAERTLEVVRNYDLYSGETLEALTREVSGDADPAEFMPLPDVARDLLYPDVATTMHVEAVRGFLIAGGGDVPAHGLEQGGAVAWQARVEAYEDVWHAFGPRFGRMWRGAWQTLFSDSEDAVRQSADSGRELLSQLLREMVPDERFTSEEIKRHGHDGAPTRAMRVKYVVKAGLGSDRSEAWAKAQAKALDETYYLMSRQSHETEDVPIFQREHVVGQLEALGGFIRFLFACYQGVRS